VGLNTSLASLLATPGIRSTSASDRLAEEKRAGMKKTRTSAEVLAPLLAALQESGAANAALAQNSPELIQARAQQAGNQEYLAGLQAMPEPTDPIASMQFPEMPTAPGRDKRPTAQSPSITPMEGLGIALSALIAPQAAPSVATGIAQGAQQRAEAANQEAIAQWETKQQQDEADYKDRIYRRQTAVAENLMKAQAAGALSLRKQARAENVNKARADVKTSEGLVSGLSAMGSAAGTVASMEAKNAALKMQADAELSDIAFANSQNDKAQEIIDKLTLGQVSFSQGIDMMHLEAGVMEEREAKRDARQSTHAERMAGINFGYRMKEIQAEHRYALQRQAAALGASGGRGGKAALAWSKEKRDGIEKTASIWATKYNSALQAQANVFARASSPEEKAQVLLDVAFKQRMADESALKLTAYDEAGGDPFQQRNPDGSIVFYTFVEVPRRDPKTGKITKTVEPQALAGTRFQEPLPRQPRDYSGQRGTSVAPGRSPSAVALDAAGGDSIYGKPSASIKPDYGTGMLGVGRALRRANDRASGGMTWQQRFEKMTSPRQR